MHDFKHKLAGLACAVALAALAGCGGGGGGGDGGSGGGGGGGSGSPGDGSSQVPQSALQSSGSLVAYLNEVIANMTNDTGEPISLGNVTLPTSETSEPL